MAASTNSSERELAFATILVTQSSVGADTGKRITIMDAVVPKI